VKIQTKIASAKPYNSVLAQVQDILALVKFRLTLTVVFSAVMAFLIAETGPIDWLKAGLLALGGFSVAGAANALNQVLEREYDKLMKRTADRPVAAGRMSSSKAVLLAGVLSTSGCILLAFIHPLSSFLGMLALLSYAFLYTPMKRISTAAIAIGAFPGALPVLIGCVASQGEITQLGLALFSLQFFWQFPHFGAIGWLGFDDYRKAGFRFIASANDVPDRSVGIHSMFYSLLLIPIGLIPFIKNETGLISAIILVTFSLAYAHFGLNLYRKQSRNAALLLMLSSLLYMPIVMVALWIDKI
jgi:protoheme IX farnesyltransferase